jgi:hypothetical protein
LTNREAADLIERLGRCIAALCHVVSPDDHSITTRVRAVVAAEEAAG